MKYLKIILALVSISQCIYAQTWTALNSTTTENLYSVNFRLSYQFTMAGWAVGDNNTGISTQDGGNNWYTSIVTNKNNYCVYFTLVDFGHVVGANSLLWYTNVGGLFWFPRSNPASPNYYGVWFAYRDTGFAVGENGIILKTIDEGDNWAVNTSGTTSHLRFIVGRDVNNAWTVGDNGTIIHTSNGGANWNMQISSVTQNLRSVSFTSLDSGWVCGDNGTILFTANGGANWNLQNTNTTKNLNGIYFTDAHNGWAVGDSGVIIHTSNGGANWNFEVSNTTEKLNAVHFYDLQNGWAVGNNGTIRRYALNTEVNENTSDNLAVQLYPNPVGDYLQINASNKYLNQLISYEIKDITGQVISKGAFKNYATINVQSLSRGIYFLSTLIGEHTNTQSLIK